MELRFSEDGTIEFTTGTQYIGQGHETSFPQIISDLLGVATENIRYRAGDTDMLPKGGGHGNSHRNRENQGEGPPMLISSLPTGALP